MLPRKTESRRNRETKSTQRCCVVNAWTTGPSRQMNPVQACTTKLYAGLQFAETIALLLYRQAVQRMRSWASLANLKFVQSAKVTTDCDETPVADSGQFMPINTKDMARLPCTLRRGSLHGTFFQHIPSLPTRRPCSMRNHSGCKRHRCEHNPSLVPLKSFCRRVNYPAR